MKLELLADILKKDAAELVSTLNLQNGQDEVSDDIVKSEIDKFTKELEINSKVLGKKEAEGMARRLVMSDVEKRLKSSFEIDGKDFDEIINSLSTKIETISKSGSKDDELKKQVDTWKSTVKELQGKLDLKDKEFEGIRTKDVVKSKIMPILAKFEFATEKVQEIAINQFLSENQFTVEGEDIFLEKGGKFYSNPLEMAETHFKDFGKLKESKPGAPQTRSGATSYGGNLKELYAKIGTAKTPEERQAILVQIEALEKV